MRTYDLRVFWDEEEAWSWVYDTAREAAHDEYDIEMIVTKLDNGAYRAAICSMEAQGELFE